MLPASPPPGPQPFPIVVDYARNRVRVGEEGSRLQLKVLLAVPSCVPALPGFEDAGATITPDDIREALQWEGVAGLGEMMNMPGVIESDVATHEMIGALVFGMAIKVKAMMRYLANAPTNVATVKSTRAERSPTRTMARCTWRARNQPTTRIMSAPTVRRP